MGKKISIREYLDLRIDELRKFADEWEWNSTFNPTDYPERLSIAEWTEQETVFGELSQDEVKP